MISVPLLMLTLKLLQVTVNGILTTWKYSKMLNESISAKMHGANNVLLKFSILCFPFVLSGWMLDLFLFFLNFYLCFQPQVTTTTLEFFIYPNFLHLCSLNHHLLLVFEARRGNNTTKRISIFLHKLKTVHHYFIYWENKK